MRVLVLALVAMALSGCGIVGAASCLSDKVQHLDTNDCCGLYAHCTLEVIR